MKWNLVERRSAMLDNELEVSKQVKRDRDCPSSYTFDMLTVYEPGGIPFISVIESGHS